MKSKFGNSKNREGSRRNIYREDLFGRIVVSCILFVLLSPIWLVIAGSTGSLIEAYYAHRIAAHWPTTKGRLINVQFEPHNDPVVEYEYNIGGNWYRSSVFSETSCLDRNSRAHERFEALEPCLGYEAALTIFYDEHDPGSACLHRDFNTYTCGCFIVGYLVIVGLLMTPFALLWIEHVRWFYPSMFNFFKVRQAVNFPQSGAKGSKMKK